MEAPHLVTRNFLRTALFVVVVSVLVFIFSMMVGSSREGGFTHSAQATSTATTTVTVLNTPPLWTVYAQELYESSTSSPSNSGTTTSWVATATDSNGENWYLLICKSSSTPIAGTSTAPSCSGGISDRWGVSASTLSGSPATVSTTTTEAMAEKNDWYAYICDGNAGAPRCNVTQWNGDSSGTSSPFMVNHRPSISTAADTSPTDPGAQVDWTTTADDADTLGGDDTIQLHVCKLQDFNATVPSCGVGGYWASSTYVTSNPTATTSIVIPTQDRDYAAYVYIVDEHKHPALTANYPWHSSSTILTVANVAPYVSTSSIGIFDVFGTTTSDTNLALTVPEGETSNFVIEFDVSDDNSCLTSIAGNEITDVDINVYRSSVAGGSSCAYNANNCYTYTEPTWVPTCYQVAGTCSGASDPTVTWECRFPLWFIADATDVGSFYAADTWAGAVRGTDDDTLTGSFSASTTNAEMTQFLSFRATGSPVAYGSFEPGFGNSVHPATTTVYATGNTGLDHYLSGDAMCPNYPTCSNNATSTIYVPYQHYATTSAAFTYGFQLGVSTFELSTSTLPVLVNMDIRKPTSTTALATCAGSGTSCDDTYWGILVPGTITLAGDYIGRNYIDAMVAPSSVW